jgi:hypothetical protein
MEIWEKKFQPGTSGDSRILNFLLVGALWKLPGVVMAYL